MYFLHQTVPLFLSINSVIFQICVSCLVIILLIPDQDVFQNVQLLPIENKNTHCLFLFLSYIYKIIFESIGNKTPTILFFFLYIQLLYLNPRIFVVEFSTKKKKKKKKKKKNK